jgi:hypothetical protein
MYWRYPGFKMKAITLSYDDGRNFDRQMVEILDKYGVRCTFNLNSSKLFTGSDKFVTPEEMPELYKNHEVAVHTLNHPHMHTLSPGQVAYQLMADRKNLEDIMGMPVEGMAYPYNLYETPTMISEIAACGIRYARTTNNTRKFDLPGDYLRWNPTCHQNDPQINEIIDKFLQPLNPKQMVHYPPKLLYIWGHSYEYENNWEPLETMCQKIGGHEDIWYPTNGELIDYISALRNLRRTADGRIVHNPTDQTLFVYANDKEFILKPGTTTDLTK